jgi:hypothetical protein
VLAIALQEESPIYLIDKQNVEKDQPPNVEIPIENLVKDMKNEIESALSLAPSYQTLQVRSTLAQVK